MKSKEEKEIYEDYYKTKDSCQSIMYKWYKDKYFGKIKDKKILEIGCGNGGVVQYLKQDNEVHAVDISKNAVEFLNCKGIESYLADISVEPLPFNDKTFDDVIVLETLEHLKSPQYAIEEIQRVLKKDGIMIASVPNPRTGHKFIYPSLFKFSNFKEYLINNKFLIKSVTTYGICPPFWDYLKPILVKEWHKQKRGLDLEKEETTSLSKLARLLSSDSINKIKPKMYGWSFVYECINVNPDGAKHLYKEIADETKEAYD